MAHSFVLAFENEIAAFRAYAKIFPHNAVFLIDTYDTFKGAANAVKVAKEMEKDGHTLKGVRLDSGDMTKLSKNVRHILDEAGLSYVDIVASSGFDEYGIRDVLAKGANINAFGVGTKLGVSADAPYMDIVYKLVRLGNHDVRKLSSGKETLAGQKQVFRIYEPDGSMKTDIIGTRHEHIERAVPLMEKVMENGKWLMPHPGIDTIRNRFEKTFRHYRKSIKRWNKESRFR